MDAEVTLFTKPEELIAWADTFDILLNPSIEDAAILLNYMEGHDYAIGIDSDGKMYRQDVAEENGEIEPYPIDDVIDTVCEWNYELILDADAHRNDPKDFKDYSEYQDKYHLCHPALPAFGQEVHQWRNPAHRFPGTVLRHGGIIYQGRFFKRFRSLRHG